MCVMVGSEVAKYLAEKAKKIAKTLNEHEKPIFIKALKDMAWLKAREKAGADMSEEMAIVERTFDRLKDSTLIATLREITSDLTEIEDVQFNKLEEILNEKLKG